MEYGGEGGIHSGAARLALRVAWRPCKTAMPFCRTLTRVLTLPQGDLCIQKSLNFRSGFLMEYGGEGGIRTLDTFSRIHTFQACSFSLSDTSPYCRARQQRGATIGSRPITVKQYLVVFKHLVKHCAFGR